MIAPGLVVFAASGWVAVRMRRGVAALGLVGVGAMLCGAGPAAEDAVIVGGGVSGGRYQIPCGPRRDYVSAAVQAEYRKALSPDLQLVVGGQLAAAGIQGERVPDENSVVPESMELAGSLGFLPYIGIDHTFVAVQAGVLTGPLSINGNRRWALPHLAGRLGPRSLVFLDAKLSDHIAGPVPAGWIQVGLGVGLLPRVRGDWNHPVLRAGISDSGFYGHTELPVTSRGLLDVFVVYGDQNFWRVGAGFRFRLTSTND